MSSIRVAIARSSLASSPNMVTKRAPDILAARAKSIPKAAPTSSCSFGSKEKLRCDPERRTSTFVLSSGPSGTSSSRTLGSPARTSSSAAWRVRRSSSPAWIAFFRPPTSAMTALASPPDDLILPMSLESALRRACFSWMSVCNWRTDSSRSMIVSATAAAPRRASALSSASGWSRNHLRSSTVSHMNEGWK